MSRLVLPVAIPIVLLMGCVDQPDPPTSLPDAPTPVAAESGLRFRSDCVSVWDREIDGDWKGLVMFTDTAQVVIDTIAPGRHAVSMTRWLPAPVQVFEDSVTVTGETPITLGCQAPPG
jgi:hypothetical protein